MSKSTKANGSTSDASRESEKPATAQPVSEVVPIPGQSGPSRYLPLVERTGMNGSSLTRHLTMDTPITECPTNLDPKNPAHRALLFAAGNPADHRIGSDNRCIITATHWLAYPDEREDPETGEVRQFATICLFDRNGKFFKTTSAYAPRRLKAAIELFTPADWSKGITFVVTVRLGQQKRPYHDIRIIVDECVGVPGD